MSSSQSARPFRRPATTSTVCSPSARRPGPVDDPIAASADAACHRAGHRASRRSKRDRPVAGHRERELLDIVGAEQRSGRPGRVEVARPAAEEEENGEDDACRHRADGDDATAEDRLRPRSFETDRGLPAIDVLVEQEHGTRRCPHLLRGAVLHGRLRARAHLLEAPEAPLGRPPKDRRGAALPRRRAERSRGRTSRDRRRRRSRPRDRPNAGARRAAPA